MNHLLMNFICQLPLELLTESKKLDGAINVPNLQCLELCECPFSSLASVSVTGIDQKVWIISY